MRQGFDEIQVEPGRHLDHGVSRDDVLFERSHRDHRLDRGTGDESGGKGEFLIHDAQNTARIRVDSHDRAVITSEPGYGSLTHDRIVKSRNITQRGINEGRNAAHPRSVRGSSCHRRRRGWGKSKNREEQSSKNSVIETIHRTGFHVSIRRQILSNGQPELALNSGS